MRDLEQQLGAKLFVRTNKGIRLTEAGVLFLQHVSKILVQISIAESAVQELASGKGGSFTVGGDWRLPIDLVPRAVKQLRESHPKVKVTLMELQMHEQMTALREQRIHIGFFPIDLLGVDEGMETLRLVHSDICVVFPQSHELAERIGPHLEELKQAQWIALDEKIFPGSKALYRRLLRPMKIKPQFGPAAQGLEGILARVSAGEGVALIPRIMLPRSHSQLRVLTMEGLSFELYAVWPKEGASPLVPALLSILEGMLASPPLIDLPSKRQPPLPKSP